MRLPDSFTIKCPADEVHDVDVDLRKRVAAVHGLAAHGAGVVVVAHVERGGDILAGIVGTDERLAGFDRGEDNRVEVGGVLPLEELRQGWGPEEGGVEQMVLGYEGLTVTEATYNTTENMRYNVTATWNGRETEFSNTVYLGPSVGMIENAVATPLPKLSAAIINDVSSLVISVS